jgi:hypothetical protein
MGHERTYAAHKLRFYLISSSARQSGESGTLMPRVRSVLRFVVRATAGRWDWLILGGFPGSQMVKKGVTWSGWPGPV